MTQDDSKDTELRPTWQTHAEWLLETFGLHNPTAEEIEEARRRQKETWEGLHPQQNSSGDSSS